MKTDDFTLSFLLRNIVWLNLNHPLCSSGVFLFFFFNIFHKTSTLIKSIFTHFIFCIVYYMSPLCYILNIHNLPKMTLEEKTLNSLISIEEIRLPQGYYSVPPILCPLRMRPRWLHRENVMLPARVAWVSESAHFTTPTSYTSKLKIIRWNLHNTTIKKTIF